MFAVLLTVMAAARVIEAANDNEIYNNFGSVVVVRAGERTPITRDGTPVLTALGAQQMYELGQNFRSRYITDLGQSKALEVQNIANMSLDLIDNDQIFIQTPDQPYLVAAAQAFMQGLYPPYSLNSTRTGPLADATGLLANGTAIDFPLNGYQYPNIQALSELDPQSIYIDGTTSCPNSQLSSASYEITQEFRDTQAAEQSFYQSLDRSWFDADFNFDLDYRYAWEIWDAISYAYNHDSDALEKLSNDSTYAGVYDRLRVLANTDAWYRYGNTSSGSSDPQAMAGKTLAARILGMFQKIVANSGNTTDSESYPLTVLFGEDEPFVSFFSIAMVDAYSANFHARPAPGSAMMFELFTMQRDATFPADHDDLKIRFWYHNATEGYGDDGPTAFSLFGNGPSNMDMKWSEFQDMMSRVMVNQLSDWCDTCSSGSLFCWGVDDSTIQITLTGREKHKLSPVVAGVIGAIVTLVVAGLLFAAAMLLGGIRFHRLNRGKKSELGGFKGSAKLASDADLSLPNNGVAPAGIVSFGKDGDKKVTHERVGSWELRQKEFGTKAGDIGDESRRESFEAIEAAMGRPVEPTERV